MPSALVACLVAGLLVLPHPARSDVDPLADIVFLRKDCSAPLTDVEVLGSMGTGTLKNCFTTTDSLTDWIGTERNPSEPSPLLVDIGPGEFGPVSCGARLQGGLTLPTFSFVTFRGAGRERTTLRATGVLSAGVEAWSSDCHDLAFQDLTAAADVYGGLWNPEAGNSTWTNVDVVGGVYGWAEIVTLVPCDPNSLAVHYWWNARIIGGTLGDPVAAYQANCGESWFYGSDLALIADPSTTIGLFEALAVGGNPANGQHGKGDVRLFGSTIRVIASDISDTEVSASGIVGVRVFETGVFHMHGGIINVTVSDTNPSEVIGLDVHPGGFAHTPGTAFNVSGGLGQEDGKTSRVKGAGALSPFLQPPGQDPPRANPGDPNSAFLTSTTGSDLFVETDCNSAGDCSGQGTETHLMIYNEANCEQANPWFDTVTGACRGGGGGGPASEICDDGIDNDGDGKIDCADKPDCRTDPACS